MNKKEQIRKALAAFSGQYGPAPTILATVTSVNEAEQTCVLTDDDNDGTVYNDVRLRPVIDGNSSTAIIPLVGTWGLAIMIEGGQDAEWMLIGAGQITKLIVMCGTFQFEVTNTGFKIASATDSLKQILSDLITDIQAITVTTPDGPSSVPNNAAQFEDITARIEELLT